MADLQSVLETEYPVSPIKSYLLSAEPDCSDNRLEENSDEFS